MPASGTTEEEYWKDDFRPLQDSAKAVTAALKADETSSESDLYRRLASTSSAASTQQPSWTGSEPTSQPHAYHANKDNDKTATLTLKHVSSKPLPEILDQAKRGMQRTSFMGVLPALGWGYLTVDASIFVFSLESDSTGNPETLLSFENPRKQSILAAQLVKPRPGTLNRELSNVVGGSWVSHFVLLSMNGN